MKKAFIPASFLSKAMGTKISVIQNENQIFLIREEGKPENVSRLYRLFFDGEKLNPNEAINTEQPPPSEPDYYNSYE
ncbi:MAG: hypothetical protein IPK31_04590 [Chitinophagaceae bacterium]|nr:hypothetical protein [Chitinophagaceae bacterium]